MKLLVINGPNLNLLGRREPEIYGRMTYDELCDAVRVHCDRLCVECEIYQSNHEGDIIDAIQSAVGRYDAILINAAAYTHTSVAIGDALRAVALPTAEVHLTDITKREDFRRISYIRDACVGCFFGKGVKSYTEATDLLREICEGKKQT